MNLSVCTLYAFNAAHAVGEARLEQIDYLVGELVLDSTVPTWLRDNFIYHMAGQIEKLENSI